MTTQTKTETAPWWERLVENTDGGAARLLRPIAAIAVVIVLGVTAWNFFSKSAETDRDRVAEVVYQGLAILPDNPPTRVYGDILDPRYPQVSLASFFYWQKTQEYQPFKFMYYGLVDAEKAKEYYDKIGGVLAEFRDVEAEAEGTRDAWLYWLTRSELHWQAALNSPDVPTRIGHFEKQLEILDRMAGDFADHPIMDLRPDPANPEATIVDLWKKAATAERDFLRNEMPAYPTVAPDDGLDAVITFDDGKTAKLRFYSKVAPKSVLTFITNARNGLYDGSAVHGVDSTVETVALGDPLSRIADRPMIWHKSNPGFIVPPETSAVLPIKRGSVTTENAGTGGHGHHFVVHTKAPESLDRGVAVFAEVVEGIENFEALLDEEVFDAAGVENPNLPRRRIGIASVTIDGEIQHPDDDSWKPLQKDPVVPEITDDEKSLNDLYFGKTEESGDDAPIADPETPADDDKDD